MIGRYGPDQLNMALIILAILVGILANIIKLNIITLLSYLLLILVIFRMLSRNLNARRRENDRFLKFWWPVKQKIKSFFDRAKSSRNYRFFRCPGCRNTLRVPRGKGKIQITCPRCGERFIKRS